MEILIITGMSGGGKTAVLNICQDKGYYTLDNLPPKLIGDMITLLQSSTMEKDKMALVMDLRSGALFGDLHSVIEELKSEGHQVKVIYLDATNEALIKRYKELRRPHPLGRGITIEKAIAKERQNLSKVKDISDVIIDTSNYNLARLKLNLEKALEASEGFLVQIVSFGFKNGILNEADMVLDVRLSDNPFYIPELKAMSGKEQPVADYVLAFEQVQEFIVKTKDLIEYIVPYYIKQGKESLVLGIGCTGGKHRSVAIAEKLGQLLSENLRVEIYHRDSNLW